MSAIDLSDPCARAAALRAAYYTLVQGGAETMIRYRGPEGEREVRYKAPDMNTLLSELRVAETECSATTGGPNPGRRYAIRAGARRF